MRRQTSKQRSDAATNPSAIRPRYGRSGMVQQFAEGRTCSDPGCTTRLSRYNALPTCAVHGDEDRRPL